MAAGVGAVDPEIIYGLYAGGFRPQVIRLALLLDVFTALDGDPAGVEAVAATCRCNETGMKALLEYLVVLDLLEKHGDQYQVTPTARAFLVRSSKSYAGGWVLAETSPGLWESLLEALRTGQPAPHPLPWAQDAWLESYRASRLEEGRAMWQAAGVDAGTPGGLRVLDLACGCAVKSLVLAQANPETTITAMDRADVLAAAKDLAERMGVAAQLEARPGDLLAGNYGGEELYNAALLGQITGYFNREQNRAVFRAVLRALAPNGVLVIDSPLAGQHDPESAALVGLAFWALTGGGIYSAQDYIDLLHEAGFRQARAVGDHWIAAVK